jgi:hypothetical protein
VNRQAAASIDCPYCGERIELLVDGSAGEQEYIEDCPVCCRPILLRVSVGEDGDARVESRREDD